MRVLVYNDYHDIGSDECGIKLVLERIVAYSTTVLDLELEFVDVDINLKCIILFNIALALIVEFLLHS